MIPYDIKHVSRINTTVIPTGNFKYFDLTMELQYKSPQFKELKTPFACALWHKYTSTGHSTAMITKLTAGFGVSPMHDNGD